jgi:hypothetical protein
MEAIAEAGETDDAWTAYSRILERPIYRRQAPTKTEETD